MTLSLIKPPQRWEQVYQIQLNSALEAEDVRNRKKGTDIEMGPNEKLVLRSPNGARWQVTVSNLGILGVTAL